MLLNFTLMSLGNKANSRLDQLDQSDQSFDMNCGIVPSGVTLAAFFSCSSWLSWSSLLITSSSIKRALAKRRIFNSS